MEQTGGEPPVQARLRTWRQGGEVALARFAIGVLRALGPVAASNVMGGLCRMAGPLLPVTRVADANLRAALPGLDAAARRRVVCDMWESLGRTAGEFPHLASLPKNSSSGPGWEMVGEEHLLAQAARGGPAIFVSGHIGNWEMLPAATAAYGMPLSSVYRPGANPALDEVVLALRRGAIGENLPMFPKGSKGARAAVVHMARKGYLGMLVDQKMNDGIEARLFGLKAMTAPAAAALAVRFGCPVIPGRVQRIGPARFRMVCDPPLTPPSTGDQQADVAALTQTINDHLERWIRERPHEWLWLHRRFPKEVTQAGAS